MKPMDLTGLIKGLMVVIGIAMMLGKLDDLKLWAAKEAFGRPHSSFQQGYAFGGPIKSLQKKSNAP